MHLVFGKPLASSVAMDHRLPILLALPLFAADALSSTAYASEEILIVLARALRGEQLAPYLLWLSIGVVALMVLVGINYTRSILHYPTGGGTYTVSRRNLGGLWGLVAGTALFVDYNLTVAVSASAGVAALASFFPVLLPYRAYLAIALVVIMCIVNLRGVKESGAAFLAPAVAYVTMLATVIIASLVHIISGTVVPAAPPAHPIEATAPFSILLLIIAFSSGCSALTGVEAVSNGVSVFKPPEGPNAVKTLGILVVVLALLFLGVSYSAAAYHILPSHGETLVSQLARANFGNGILYMLTIFSTVGILMVASNTAFASLPQLLANMARDSYAPRVLLSQGDRLVFNRSIVGMTVISTVLIAVFNANVSGLIPLYAVGVFLVFTLAQFSMVLRIWNDKEPGWPLWLLSNGLGSLITASVCVVIAVSRFKEGSWLVVVVIPLLVLIGLQIKKHYHWFQNRLAIHDGDFNPLRTPVDHLTVVVLISSDIHRGTLEGLEAAKAVVEGRPGARIRGLHIELDPAKTRRLKEKWDSLVVPHLGHLDIELDIVPSPYRWLVQPVLAYLDQLDEGKADHRVVVLLAEFETGSYWTQMLHNQSTLGLRKALFNRPNVTIITNRFFLKPGLYQRGSELPGQA
jgi:amino acid transporter